MSQKPPTYRCETTALIVRNNSDRSMKLDQQHVDGRNTADKDALWTTTHAITMSTS